MSYYPVSPGPPLLPPQMSLRMRKENDPKYDINARIFQNLNAAPATPGNYIPDLHAQPTYMDMKPTQTRSYLQNFDNAPRYDPKAPSLQSNAYFQKYDITTDPRNVAREIQGAVVEPMTERGKEYNQKLMARNFQIRHMSQDESKYTTETALDAYERMKPKLNDMKAVFR